MSKPTNPPQHTCPQQTQGRQDGPLVPPPGPKVEAQKEFLKAVLARGQTTTVLWRDLVRDYFFDKAKQGEESKVQLTWSLRVPTRQAPAEKAVIMQAAMKLAQKAADAQEVANKLKRLVARVSLAQDKADLLAAVARFFPRLQQGTQKAINACEDPWQSWDLHSLKQLFLLTKIFYEAYEQN